MSRLAIAFCSLMSASLCEAQAPSRGSSDVAYLYVWATAVDTFPTAADSTAPPHRRGLVLATVDLREGSPTRGQVIGAIAVGDSSSRLAHHTEHALPADGLFFANDFNGGKTYRFDLRNAGAPRLLGSFTTAGPFAHPHSFVRLASGNVLSTYQVQAAGKPPGGLAELRRDGSAVRWARAAAPGVDSTVLLPYSLEVVPALDRVVTTSTSMAGDVGVHVQIWRLSDLTLLHTLVIPPAPRASATEHDGHMMSADDTASHHLLPGEPRLLADGRTIMFGTFTCGLYRLTGLDSASPRLAFVQAFPGRNCAVPVRIGHWWVQTVPALHSLVALDVADPAHPRETSRLEFEASTRPHWLAADSSGRRIVMNSGTPTDPRIHLATFDPRTGALAADRDVPTVDVARLDVRGLGVVRLIPHGAVFGPDRTTSPGSRPAVR